MIKILGGTEESGVFAEHEVNTEADIVSAAAGVSFFLCGNIQGVECWRCIAPTVCISVASIAGKVGEVSSIHIARPANAFAE